MNFSTDRVLCLYESPWKPIKRCALFNSRLILNPVDISLNASDGSVDLLKRWLKALYLLFEFWNILSICLDVWLQRLLDCFISGLLSFLVFLFISFQIFIDAIFESLDWLFDLCVIVLKSIDIGCCWRVSFLELIDSISVIFDLLLELGLRLLECFDFLCAWSILKLSPQFLYVLSAVWSNFCVFI